MNEKTRIVKSAGESLSACTDSDITVFVGNENTGANDHPPVSRNPGLEANPVAMAASDATVIVDSSPAPRQAPSTGPALPAPRAAVHFEPSSAREGAVTKTVIKGRFELDKLLGVGGMGAVFKALDRRKLEANDSNPYVAIKLLNEDFQKHPDAFVSLQREARKSQTLAHPNIVTVFDFDREGDRVFMTMEFLEGSPLDKLLRENSGVGVGKEKAVAIFRDVAQALIYAHSHRIVHSDFKPGNIFVTNRNGAKVIDFGIARAVSEGGIASKAGEQTIFDAGTLGALTPAYASLEMLQGGEPQPSDDVYALGCVAYELFSGRHPFDKLPADKAFEKKLKPKRIKSLSRRQWRALEAALAFHRADRTPTVERFVHRFFTNSGWKWALGSLFLAVLVGVGFGYSYLEKKNAAEQKRVAEQLEREHQRKLLEDRISGKREAIDRLVALTVLTPSWERDLRIELGEYESLNPSDSEYPERIRQQISDLFVSAATGQLTLGNLEPADEMLARAAAWNTLVYGADQIRQQIQEERDELQRKLEAERLAEEREAERIRLQALQEQRRLQALKKQRELDAELDEMEQALTCSFSMRVGDVATSLTRLAGIDETKAQKIRPVVADEFAGCFTKLANRSPVRTDALLTDARAMLPEQRVLAEFDLDYCGHLSPGSGGKGERYSCADPMLDGASGPELVVVKGDGGRPVAVGKYEVSNGEFREYCLATGACGDLPQGVNDLPVNNIEIAQAQGYLAWLSEQTGRTYRLPSEREWFAAASAGGQPEIADRNCYLNYGGIEKGAELVPSTSGAANQYGIVNAVGNVQEWVLGSDGDLLAAGGNHLDAMSRCLTTSKIMHDGAADEVTGFRVVRSLTR
ncbi:protein kinase domain-containing protein [Microbulbifer sp. SA54]|uniref:bifunctional serine/threonine-protein kinase/formylglycine-generating enzyme family protein n=1 Tax=Microbulbifer sp. SA54 TaxID=3401577 RepID=UPI003AAB3CFF